MNSKELKEKIVQMLWCREIHDFEAVRRDQEKLWREEVSKVVYRVECEKALESYEKIITFILKQLDNDV